MKSKGLSVSLILFSLLAVSSLSAQEIKLIQKGDNHSPSFYDITKIHDNEYWLGGEFGVLSIFDTLGNSKNIDLPFDISHILRIKNHKNKVYISTSDGQMITYCKDSKKFHQYNFNNDYRKYCFYDFIILDNDSVYICGGSKRIASGRIALPNGFILKTSIDFKQIEKIYSSKNKFVWTLFFDEQKKQLLMSSFSVPHMKSTISFTEDGGANWNQMHQVNGIVCNLLRIEDDLWYAGSKNLLYRRNGMIGKIAAGENRQIVKKSGCIYNLAEMNKQLICCNFNGKFISIDVDSRQEVHIPKINSYPLYRSAKISTNKCFIVGHAQTVYLIEN
jgi:hypothetical protein